jgi:hypothetical protein
MNMHCLKTHPGPFQAVWDGIKTFDFREDDRGFEVGDSLILEEWDPAAGNFTGRSIMVDHVPYILRGPAYGVPEGHVILSVTPTTRIGPDAPEPSP